MLNQVSCSCRHLLGVGWGARTSDSHSASAGRLRAQRSATVQRASASLLHRSRDHAEAADHRQKTRADTAANEALRGPVCVGDGKQWSVRQAYHCGSNLTAPSTVFLPLPKKFRTGGQATAHAQRVLTRIERATAVTSTRRRARRRLPQTERRNAIHQHQARSQ